jgi:hypothetical protein
MKTTQAPRGPQRRACTSGQAKAPQAHGLSKTLPARHGLLGDTATTQHLSLSAPFFTRLPPGAALVIRVPGRKPVFMKTNTTRGSEAIQYILPGTSISISSA